MFYGQIQHFFAMGGYGIYIWPAYGITFVILLMNIIFPWLRHKQILRQQLPTSSITILSPQSHVTDS